MRNSGVAFGEGDAARMLLRRLFNLMPDFAEKVRGSSMAAMRRKSDSFGWCIIRYSLM